MQKSLGTKLKIGTVSVAELTSIGGLELSSDTIETTTLDCEDGYRTFEGGLKDAGEVSLSGYLKLDEGQKKVYDLFDSGDLTDFTIEFPAKLGAKWTFKGIVTSFKTGAELEDGISFESSIKVSGKPSLNIGNATA